MKKQLLACATVLGLGVASGTLAQPQQHSTGQPLGAYDVGAELGLILGERSRSVSKSKSKNGSRESNRLLGAQLGSIIGAMYGLPEEGRLIGSL